jgi:DNA-binding HxlR family transcriptional regulator
MVAKHGAAVTRTTDDAAATARGSAPRLRPVDGVEQESDAGADVGALALDRLIHERMRLGIVSALAVNDSLTFNDLKRVMRTTDGNLSVHARKLEDAKYITCTKSFEGRVPRTEYKLTTAGRRALERYLDHMEALIRATRER